MSESRSRLIEKLPERNRGQGKTKKEKVVAIGVLKLVRDDRITAQGTRG